MISKETLESYRLVIQKKRHALQKRGELTDAKRHKLMGAELILATILRKQQPSYFYKLAVIDGDGRCIKVNTMLLKQALMESPLQASEKHTTT